MSLNCKITETIYKSFDFVAKGQKYQVIKATGKFNYINISKISNNPYRGPGKEFKNFDEAQKHYKCPEIKLQLLNIELFQ